MDVPRFVLARFRQSPRKAHFFRSLRLGTKGGTSKVASEDGTSISVRRSGSGPSVVLIHGALDGMGGWSFIEPMLTEDHTVSVYDRRGRGGSRDTASWSIEREVEDLVAVLKATPEPVHVVGHSFGAVIAMLAALSGVEMASLTLYEPPMNGDQIPLEHLEEISSLVEGKDLDVAIAFMATKLAGLNDEEVKIALGVPPVRNTLRDGVMSAPREIAALRELEWVGLPISGVRTLLLRGAQTPTRSYPRPDQYDSISSDLEVVEIVGQRHLAQTFAPVETAQALREFLAKSSL